MRILLLTWFTLFFSQAFCDVQSTKLPNGLTIVVKEDHRAPVAVSMVWYHVGSADEPGGITGVAHVLEHLMFKGTKKNPAGVFSKKIAGVGGQENAFTNYDYTAYFEKIAASHLALSFELEADRMQHLLLDENEFNREIKVVQEERRLRTDDNPQALTFERFLASAHLSTPYHHPVIGWMSDLQQMTIHDARAWYKTYYAPNNATVVVVGDVVAKDVFKLAKQYFGAIPAKTKVIRKSQIEPIALGKKKVTVNVPAQLPLLMLGYTVPTVASASTQDMYQPYALELIAGLLSAGENGRFSKHLIREKQIASHADTGYNLYERYQTQFLIYGVPSRTHTVKELKKAMLAEIKRLKNELVDEVELKRIKTQIIAQKTFERDSIFSQAMEIGLLETIGLGWQTSEKYIERIEHISAQDIQQTARRYFNAKGQTQATLIPSKKNERPS